MSSKLKRYIILFLTGFGLYGLYIFVMVVLGQPLWVLLLAYAVFMSIFYYFNRASIWAVRGNYFYVMGHKAQAKPLLRKAIAVGTKSPSAYIYLALMLVQEDKNADEAFVLLEKAQKLSVSIVDERNALTTLASCHFIKGDVAKGIEVLEDMRAKHEYTNAGVLTTLGYMYFVQGDFDKAAEFSRLAMEDDPTHGAAWDNMGQISYKQGDIEAAKDNFHAALSKKQNLVDSCYHLGLIYEAEGNLDNAKEYFRCAEICTVSIYNTVTVEQVGGKYNQYHT